MPGDITLCFGLAVANDSLTFATMAYEKLKGPFRFVELVQSRVRRGNLQAEQGRAVARLPNELWEMIRHKVTEIELEAAERTFVAKNACDNYNNSASDRDAEKPSIAARSWRTMFATHACWECLYSYPGFFDPALAIPCRQMLRDYNLDLPTTWIFPQDITESRRADGDPTAAAILALPRNPAPVDVDPYDQLSCYLPEVSEDEPYADGLWNISLETPAGASERFRKLVNDLHLVPLVINDGTIGLPHKSKNKRMYKEVNARQVKPRWMLFTTVFFDQS